MSNRSHRNTQPTPAPADLEVPPCPAWCECPTGHPYESLELAQDGRPTHDQRYHRLPILSTVDGVMVDVDASETRDLQTGEVRVDAPGVWCALAERGDVTLSATGAREVASALLEAAHRLETLEVAPATNPRCVGGHSWCRKDDVEVATGDVRHEGRSRGVVVADGSLQISARNELYENGSSSGGRVPEARGGYVYLSHVGRHGESPGWPEEVAWSDLSLVQALLERARLEACGGVA